MAASASAGRTALTVGLHSAALRGDRARVEELLVAGARPDARPPGETTPLIAAASAGHADVIEALLSRGANVNFVHGGKRDGTTALMEAIRHEQVGAARVLLAAGADPALASDHDYTGQPNTCVAEAVRLCHRIHEALAGTPLEKLAGFVQPPDDERTLRLRDRLSAAHELVREMIARAGGARPDMLIDAAGYGNVDLVRVLLDGAVDVNAEVGGETAFGRAVQWHAFDVAGQLLAAGADPCRGGMEGAPLHRAVADGLVEIVRAVVGACIDLNGRATTVLPAEEEAESGGLDIFLDRPRAREATPLIVAVRARRTEIAGLLVEAGADLEAADADGYTALGWALRTGQGDLVSLLRRAGAREPDDLHGSPFHRLFTAAAAGDLSGVREAIAAGADLNGLQPAPRRHLTPLMAAARNGRLDVVAGLVAAGADPNRAGRDDLTHMGVTPLMLAARGGHAGVVDALVRAGADVHARRVDALARRRDRERGETALHEAAAGGHIGAVEVLLRAGADPRCRSAAGGTPLDAAAASGSKATVEALLAAGARARKTPAPRTGRPLMAAAAAGEVETARALLQAGADPNVASRDGSTALYHAAAGCHADMVRLLLEAGAVPDGPMERPLFTPLTGAALEGCLEVVQMLLQAGARVDARGCDGRTALHAAVLKSSPEIVEALLAAGADPLAADDDGQTPTDDARALVSQCIDDSPEAWGAFGYPLRGPEAEAGRAVLRLLEVAAPRAGNG